MNSTSKYSSKKRCVAVLDVLGFRNFLEEGRVEELALQLESLYQQATSARVRWTYSNSDSERIHSGKERIHRLLFSDSIFMWSAPIPADPVKREKKIEVFSLIVASMLGSALARGLPMRAGLAFGDVVIDAKQQIVIGQPIVDAYLTEACQEWAGGAFHESFPNCPEIVEWDFEIPRKENSFENLNRALDWISPLRIGPARQREQMIARIRDFLDVQVQDATIASVRQKYLNTRAFLDSVTKEIEARTLRV